MPPKVEEPQEEDEPPPKPPKPKPVRVKVQQRRASFTATACHICKRASYCLQLGCRHEVITVLPAVLCVAPGNTILTMCR